VVPLKTRQAPPLELQTPSVARPTGENFKAMRAADAGSSAPRRRQKLDIVVYSELKVDIVVWPEAKVNIVVRPEAEFIEPGWHRVIFVPPWNTLILNSARSKPLILNSARTKPLILNENAGPGHDRVICEPRHYSGKR
jgi:hypothetical protein